MRLPAFSVERPVLTSMLCLIVVVLGVVSLTRVRIDLLPNVELPTLTIRTAYEGASPEVMERLVTSIIEEIVATVPGVEELTSMSSQGSSSVKVSFAWGTDIDSAALDVQATLEDEINELPDDIVRPRVSKFDVDSFPVVILGVGSTLDPVEVTELIDKQIRYRFGRIAGVAQVDTWGGFNREVHVDLEPGKLRALGLPLDTVLDALKDANLDLPAGRIEQGRFDVTLRAPAEFRNLDEIRSTVVALRDNTPVTLGQIATVTDSYEKLTRLIRINGDQGLRIAIRKQADANTVEVATRVLEEIERVNRDFPQLNVVAVSNQGNFIERSIENVANSVMYGGVLAVLMLLFFLRNVRSTLVISLSIPISIIATFSLIYFGGFTINLMTLGGLALGVGMMVDSSIVVLENIFRRRNELGENARQAAVAGASEVGPAIVASTITTLVIFLPLVFVQGVSGVLFQELAYVMVFSLICSLLVSLSLVPMLASRLLVKTNEPTQEQHAWITRFKQSADEGFRQLEDSYRSSLEFALRYRPHTILISAVLLAASLLLLPLIGSEFLPPSDEGEVRITGEMEVGTRLGLLDDQARRLEKLVESAVPEAVSSVTTVGANGWRPGNANRVQLALTLVPATERQRSNVEIADDLRKRLTGQIPGMVIRTKAPQGQFLLERILGGDEAMKIDLRGFDLEVLDSLARQVLDKLVDVPGVADLELSRQSGVPQQSLYVDREKAASLGISIRRIVETIETAVAGSQAGEYRSGGNSYPILVKMKDAERVPLDEILDLTLSTAGGQAVALRNVLVTEASEGPILIDRKDQQRIVSIAVNIAGRDMGSVAADVEQRLAQITRPAGYALDVTGTYEEQKKATRELIISLLLALALVYMVLASQYESLRDPIIVMTSVPVAAVGVLLTLFLTSTTLNVQSYIGCIMLAGIVVNNAILLVDQAGQLRRLDGLPTREAVVEAGRRRLRPILMTTLTTILALLPLALGIGEGADAQAPLARAVVGGLTASTLVTLVLVPVVYSLLHSDKAERST